MCNLCDDVCEECFQKYKSDCEEITIPPFPFDCVVCGKTSGHLIISSRLRRDIQSLPLNKNSSAQSSAP